MATRVYQADKAAKAAEKRLESARELLGYHLSGIRRWLFAHRRADNHPFFMMQGSPVRSEDGGLSTPTYYVDLHDCTCDSHRRGFVACKHMLAARLWMDAYRRGEVTLPRSITQADTDLLEAASLIAEDLDVANAADCLLDQYDAIQAKAKAAVKPAHDWWLTDSGAPVWLASGDTYAPDTTVPAPVPPGCHGATIAAQVRMLAREDAVSETPGVVYGEAPGEISPATPKPVGLVTRYEDLFGNDDDHT